MQRRSVRSNRANSTLAKSASYFVVRQQGQTASATAIPEKTIMKTSQKWPSTATDKRKSGE
jgi:hypothetical protein